MPVLLIVDDDEVDREAAARYLQSVDDLTLQYAEEGQAALGLVAAQRPDLVLTDLRMPGMDGLELVEKLKEEHPLLPVVLMTSYGNEQVAVKALQAGAASYVPKNDLAEHLAETVEQVLDLAETTRSQNRVLDYLSGCEIRFALESDLKLISPMAGFCQESLARIGFADEATRTQVGVALMEAISNGMIHGNLEVSSELRVDGTEPYYKKIEERQGQEPYSARLLKIRAQESPERVVYTIEDEGPGFDHAAMPDPTSPDNLTRVQGRGLMLIRMFMDEVEHNDRGNSIRMVKNFTPPQDED